LSRSEGRFDRPRRRPALRSGRSSSRLLVSAQAHLTRRPACPIWWSAADPVVAVTNRGLHRSDSPQEQLREGRQAGQPPDRSHRAADGRHLAFIPVRIRRSAVDHLMPGVPSVMPRLWHLAQSRPAVRTMLARMETRWHHRSATRPTYFLGRPTSLWLAATGARPDGSRRDDVRPAAPAS
jgi:hypothetical protein